MYLRESSFKPAAEFVAGPVWQDLERAAMDRRPPEAEPDDLPHVAAAKGFTRKGYELALTNLKKIPFDPNPEGAEVASPFGHVTDEKD